jgi:glycosyltransferase involved in cell wall biosynthesis
MRVLFVSAFYPPYVIGGWEQLVEELNGRLRDRGHTTHVLTSRHGVDRPQQAAGVDRVLHLEADLHAYVPRAVLAYRRRLHENLAWTRRVIAGFAPDVVFVHSIWNLTRGVPWMAERLCPGRVIYYVADHTLCSPDTHQTYWQDRATTRLRDAAKRILALVALGWVRHCTSRFVLAPVRILCVSRHIRDELAACMSVDPERLHVVYNGVDTRRFAPARHRAEGHSGGLELLFAGSLVRHKGVDTAIKALAILRERRVLDGVRLAIAGDGPPDFRQELDEIVERFSLASHIRFLGHVDRTAMPDLLRRFDALVFPSRWEEPLARTVQEAMATGLAVVGTPTGGTSELLVHGDTGLTFAPDSPEELADRLSELRQRPDLAETLAQRGRETVLARFDIRRTIDEMEAHLEVVASANCGARADAASPRFVHGVADSNGYHRL